MLDKEESCAKTDRTHKQLLDCFNTATKNVFTAFKYCIFTAHNQNIRKITILLGRVRKIKKIYGKVVVAIFTTTHSHNKKPAGYHVKSNELLKPLNCKQKKSTHLQRNRKQGVLHENIRLFSRLSGIRMQTFENRNLQNRIKKLMKSCLYKKNVFVPFQTT